MVLGIEIAMLIFGIITLVRGNCTVSKTKVVRGTPARVIGILAVSILPAALVIGFAYGVSVGSRGGTIDIKTAALIDVGVVLAALIPMIILSKKYAEAKEEPRGMPVVLSEPLQQDPAEQEQDSSEIQPPPLP